jgi:hypothetical protein
VNDLLDNLNDIVSNLTSEYRYLRNSKSDRLIKDCFEAKFKTSMESQLSDISHRFRELIEFLTIAQVIEELEQTIELINKNHIAYSVQELFKHMDSSFTLSESDQYVEAKKREKILKQRLHQYGIPSEWINSHFNSSQSRGEKRIPPRNTKESYSQYLNRLLGQSYGDFDEMLKVYKKITPQKDWQLYDNIKLLVNALRSNGVTKTANQLYDHLNEK